jgi:hypothetical protein
MSVFRQPPSSPLPIWLVSNPVPPTSPVAPQTLHHHINSPACVSNMRRRNDSHKVATLVGIHYRGKLSPEYRRQHKGSYSIRFNLYSRSPVSICTVTPLYQSVQSLPCINLYSRSPVSICTVTPLYQSVQPLACINLYSHSPVSICTVTPLYQSVQSLPCINLYSRSPVSICTVTPLHQSVQSLPCINL